MTTTNTTSPLSIFFLKNPHFFRVMERYKHIIVFYKDKKNPKMEKAARAEMIAMKEYLDLMRFYKNINLDNWEENPILVEITKKLKYVLLENSLNVCIG